MTPKELEDLLKIVRTTSDQITAMVSKGAHWTPHARPHRCGHGADAKITMYCWDEPTQWAWMGVMPFALYRRISCDAAQKPEQWAGIRASVAAMIAECADEPVSGEATVQVVLERYDALALLIAFYSGTTKVWNVADRLEQGGQFIVLSYRGPNASTSYLNPMVVPMQHERQLTLGELRRIVATAVARDRARNPEWFVR